ncbi:MAG: hypothetical protein JWN24_713 [Phycisphaerales bacterium]|nr:hypothetical protein [Phycisphaerales bacterium]
MIRRNKIVRFLQVAACGAVYAAGVLTARHAWTAPARQVADDVLPPMANEPQPAARGTVVPVPYRPVLDPARANVEPRLLSKDGIHPLRSRPATDIPPVAQTSASLPTPINLPAAPRMRWASPDPADVSAIAGPATPDAGRPSASTDDTLTLAPPGALEMTPPPRQVPAPFLLLALPDPRAGGEIPTPAPAREDPPVPSFDRPAKPTLPAGK